MKIISILFLSLALMGCASKLPKEVLIEVWTPPKFEEPVRPVLQSDGKGTQGEIARKVNLDLSNVTEYSIKLENIVEAIKAHKPNVNSQNNK